MLIDLCLLPRASLVRVRGCRSLQHNMTFAVTAPRRRARA